MPYSTITKIDDVMLALRKMVDIHSVQKFEFKGMSAQMLG